MSHEMRFIAVAVSRGALQGQLDGSLARIP